MRGKEGATAKRKRLKENQSGMKSEVKRVRETRKECRTGKQRNYERLPMAIELDS